MTTEGPSNGSLPSSWLVARLKHVATVRYGKALATDNRESRGKVPVYGSSMTTGFHDEAFHHNASIVIGRKGSVGSVQYVDVPFWPIDTVFFLDDVSPLVDLRFLAAALTYFGLERYKIVVGVPGLNRDDLANFSFPLPPLSEQQRIVEILQEAEAIRLLRAGAEVKAAELVPAIFRGFFGEIARNSNDWPVVPISHFVESFQGGKSLAGIETDFDIAQPRVLKISAVTSGTLDPTESKALPSTYEPPLDHYIKSGDLLITRANTPELVGATALVGNQCPPNLVLPDKIWRFIWKADFNGTTEFVWALFQEQATRQALTNIAAGTGGSMKNISMKKLMRMRVVWPPKELQENFSRALRELALLRDETIGDRTSLSLQSSLSAHAFSGQLTTDWREARVDALMTEAQERDAALRQVGATLTRSRRATTQDDEGIEEQRTDGIHADLNREQRGLLFHILENVGGVRHLRYFTADSLGRSLKGALRRNTQAIEGHLAVFAVRGLVIPVSREEQTKDTGEFVFGNAYRLALRKLSELLTDDAGNLLTTESGDALEADGVISDHARSRELERLVAQIEKERAFS